jgi:hypothetical protein
MHFNHFPLGKNSLYQEKSSFFILSPKGGKLGPSAHGSKRPEKSIFAIEFRTTVVV